MTQESQQENSIVSLISCNSLTFKGLPGCHRMQVHMTAGGRFGAWVRHWRLQDGLTQDELGEKADMDGPRIQKLESGVGNPTINTVAKIAEALGRDVSLFFAPRPEDGAERAAGSMQGSSVLDRAILEAQASTGTWRADVADALAALARAISRERDTESAASANEATRR